MTTPAPKPHPTPGEIVVANVLAYLDSAVVGLSQTEREFAYDDLQAAIRGRLPRHWDNDE